MAAEKGLKEAMFWETTGKNNKVQCRLCAHNCTIATGKRGICGVRENREGTLYSLIYRRGGSGQADPIEKKPLYHFYPDTLVTSFGTVGCNFKCTHCQNYSSSQAGPEAAHYLQPISFDNLANCSGFWGSGKCRGVAWTYNEPTVWFETTFDGSIAAKEQGLYTVYVTNGFINPDPLKKIHPYLDAMNIDVKAFTEQFYKTVSKARLRPVLDTCELAHKLGIHIELTYLIIPGYNDAMDEIRQFAEWVVGQLDANVPVHFSRYHPMYKMQDAPATPMSTLEAAHDVTVKAGVNYVYLGNVRHEYENTFCPNCHEVAISRYGYTTRILYDTENKCKNCGHKITIIN